MRSYLKLMITGFVVGATFLFGVLLFPRDWIKPGDDGGIAALLFIVGILLGLACLYTLVNIYS